MAKGFGSIVHPGLTDKLGGSHQNLRPKSSIFRSSRAVQNAGKTWCQTGGSRRTFVECIYSIFKNDLFFIRPYVWY